MKIGYVRVSTVEQNEARQIEQIKKYHVDKLFIEKVSGKNIQDRKKLKKILKEVREDDIIYIHDFSRLARSTKDLLDIIEMLRRKKVILVSFKENIDTSTPTGKLMLTMIGAINEFERENLLERQREGIIIAKQLKKYKGRKPIPFPDNWEEIYINLKEKKIKTKTAMKQLNLKKTTFYKFLKEWESK